MAKKLYAVYDMYNGDVEVYAASSMREVRNLLKEECLEGPFDFRVERVRPIEI